jgi:hypothetical protein
MQNTEREQSTGKISAPFKPQCGSSKPKQSDRGIRPNESDIYMESTQKKPDPPYLQQLIH